MRIGYKGLWARQGSRHGSTPSGTVRRARFLFGNKGYDLDWFRQALTENAISPCIQSKAKRKVHIPDDKVL